MYELYWTSEIKVYAVPVSVYFETITRHESDNYISSWGIFRVAIVEMSQFYS